MSEPAPLTVKTPSACDAPPARPTAPTSVCVQPAGSVVFTATLSKVAVFVVLVSWFVTARPARADPPGTVTVPSNDHDTPSVDQCPETDESPRRDSLSQTVQSGDVPPAMKLVAAPSCGLLMNSRPRSGLISIITCHELGSSEPRIMTPAFANVFVDVCPPRTRATSSTLPSNGCDTR